jgi:hypothetical protein
LCSERQAASLLLNVNTSNKKYIVKNEIRGLARQEAKTLETRRIFACHLFSLGARDRQACQEAPKENALLMAKKTKEKREKNTSARMLFLCVAKMPKIAGW